MKDYLINYNSIDIYHIYYSEIKIIKILYDFIFCKNKFINKYQYKSINLIKNDFDNNSEIETFVNNNSNDFISIISNSKQNDSISSIIYNKIIIQSSLKFIDIISISSLPSNHHQQ